MTDCTRSSHFNPFQGRIVHNLTHTVHVKGCMAYDQLLHLWAVSHVETPFWIHIGKGELKAALSNQYAFQFLQPNQFHVDCVLEARITNCELLQIRKEGKVELFQILTSTTTITDSQCFNAVVKELIGFTPFYALAHWLVIQPFSIKHSLAIAVILTPSSPSLSFKPFAFVFHLLNV